MVDTDMTVPHLRAGTGATPAEGGCIMQLIDWISRGTWTDRPPNVHPALRTAAIAANDRADEDARQKLLDLVPRLMDTYGSKAPVHDGAQLQHALDSVADGTRERAHCNTDYIELLVDMLDAYDEVTGRNATEPVDLPAIKRSLDECQGGEKFTAHGFIHLKSNYTVFEEDVTFVLGAPVFQ